MLHLRLELLYRLFRYLALPYLAKVILEKIGEESLAGFLHLAIPYHAAFQSGFDLLGSISEQCPEKLLLHHRE
jgi:hypothetical protein